MSDKKIAEVRMLLNDMVPDNYDEDEAEEFVEWGVLKLREIFEV